MVIEDKANEAQEMEMPVPLRHELGMAHSRLPPSLPSL